MSDGIEGWKQAGKPVTYPKIGATQADSNDKVD
jgi:hypothetical protein